MRKAQVAINRWYVPVTAAFLIFCVVQFFLSAHLWSANTRASTSPPPSHSDVHDALFKIGNATDIRDVGQMARMVSQLADLAEQHVGSTLRDSATFSTAVTKLFPFWRAGSLQYYPWMTRDASQEGPSTGIVIGVGNNYVYIAAIAIVTLRKVLKSTLPIELAYMGDEDLSPEWRQYLFDLVDRIDIGGLDLTEHFDNKLLELHGFDTKPFAILASSFPRTILLDADATFFSKPDDAFETHPALKERGALYFHDRAKAWFDSSRKPFEDRLAWLATQLAKAGHEPSTFLTHESFLWAGTFVSEAQDSSVVMIDKSRARNYMSILFTAWMNAKSGGREEIQTYFWGDKETYWIAGELTRTPFQFSAWSSGQFASAPEKSAYSTIDTGIRLACTEHMLHTNWDGKQPWISNGGILMNGKAFDSGFVNWTHWFLPEPMADALERSKRQLNLPTDFSHFTEADAQVREALAREVMSNQPIWGGCKLDRPERWKPLSQEFRDTLVDMVDRAKVLYQDYQSQRIKLALDMKQRRMAEDAKYAMPVRRNSNDEDGAKPELITNAQASTRLARERT